MLQTVYVITVQNLKALQQTVLGIREVFRASPGIETFALPLIVAISTIYINIYYHRC